MYKHVYLLAKFVSCAHVQVGTCTCTCVYTCCRYMYMYMYVYIKFSSCAHVQVLQVHVHKKSSAQCQKKEGANPGQLICVYTCCRYTCTCVHVYMYIPSYEVCEPCWCLDGIQLSVSLRHVSGPGHEKKALQLANVPQTSCTVYISHTQQSYTNTVNRAPVEKILHLYRCIIGIALVL